MAEALIQIGDGDTTRWRDGDVREVRLEDGTFTPSERRSGQYLIVKVRPMSQVQALAFTVSAPGELRRYRVDWKGLVATGAVKVGEAVATEADVMEEGREVTVPEEQNTTIFEKRSVLGG